MKRIVFGGGCFWCTEAVFKMIKGVASVTPGYAGGTTLSPTYEAVSAGGSGHAEVVEVTYEPRDVALEDLLTVFFGSHDPTTLNQQGNDVGTQYRSVIFYSDDEQKEVCAKFIADINTSSARGERIVTELEPLTTFYPAEEYHKDYFEKNPNNSYCAIVINPKLEKVQKNFANLLSDLYKK